MSGKYYFGRYLIFNIFLMFDWGVVTYHKHHQVDIDNICGNFKQFGYDYTVCNLGF